MILILLYFSFQFQNNNISINESFYEVNQVPDWITESNQQSAYFSRSVSTAGNVNDDDFYDVIIGAYYYENGELNEGRAYAYYGNLSGIAKQLRPAPELKANFIATILNGPLQLPAGNNYKIFEITDRAVLANRMQPGIYFIIVNGQIINKIIKVK